jgi:hypothetical protein
MSPLWVLDVFFYFDSIGHLLTYRATNDIGLINMDVILTQSKKFKKLFPPKINTYHGYKKIQLTQLKKQ